MCTTQTHQQPTFHIIIGHYTIVQIFRSSGYSKATLQSNNNMEHNIARVSVKYKNFYYWKRCGGEISAKSQYQSIRSVLLLLSVQTGHS